MAQEGRRAWRGKAVDVVLPLVVAIGVLYFVLPASGDDTLPPTCWAVLGYEVPCDSRLGYAAGVAAAAVVAVSRWYRRNRRR